MNPSPLFVEESVKDNLSYRSIVVWRGGKLHLSDKNLVKKFWHGSVEHDSAHSDKEKELEAQLAEKNKDIRAKDQIIRLKDTLLEARDKLISCLEEKVRCVDCHNVPTSAPLYNCPEGHIICTSCYKGARSLCPSCSYKFVGSTISLIGLTLIENIKHSCPYAECTERMDFANIAEHKKICSFKPLTCPAAHCKTKVTYEKLLEHILKECKHSQSKMVQFDSTNEKTLTYLCESEDLSTCVWKLATLIFKRRHFFLIVKTNASYSMTNAYIQMLGSSDDCLKYRVKLSICNEEGPLHLMSYDHPFSVDMKEAEKFVAGLIITNKDLKKACKPPANESEKYKFAIRIKFKEG